VILNGPHRSPSSGGEPSSLVVLLHGVGSNGADLIGLADVLAERFPDTVFHSPNAPNPYDGAHFGYQWYSRGTSEARIEGLRLVESAVNGFLEELLALYHLPATKCILVGFSQGSMVSLHVAPRRSTRLGGIVAFSGTIATADSLKNEIASKTPICLIHGDSDSVIPSERSESAAKLLTELGVPNEVHILRGLGHSIDRRGLDHATRFMQEVLA
jgi:phospholipase/carboxylesterase